MIYRTVGSDGPHDAALVVVGEGPGEVEAMRGKPFAGKTGWHVRRGLDRRDAPTTRFMNTLPNAEPVPRDPGGMRALVDRNAEWLARELDGCAPAAVLLLGRAALYRVTGRTSIVDDQNSTWRGSEFPRAVELGLGNALIVSSLHPAAAMRTKVGAAWLLIERAFDKAVRWAREADARRWPPAIDIEVPSPVTLDRALAERRSIAIDTEFDPTTSKPFLVGIAVGGQRVLSFPPVGEYVDVLRKHMMRRDLVKIAHYHVADVRALAALGVDTVAPWYDTLEAFSHLYPDLPVGLTHAARFYIDDAADWKHMAHTDPLYNAIDCVTAELVEARTRAELVEAGLWDSYWRERMPAAAMVAAMEARGMAVDLWARAAMLEESHGREVELERELQGHIAEAWATRTASAPAPTHTARANCPVKKHDAYDGLRAKKWSADPACTCRAFYETQADARAAADVVKVASRKARGYAARGFRGSNPHDMKWLLYEHWGLPVQREHKRVTTNATALRQLAVHPRTLAHAEAERIVRVLQLSKSTSQIRKERSTFLFHDRGERRLTAVSPTHAIVRPPMRLFGTGTGRPAGGSDPAVEERFNDPTAFSVMNIPNRVRMIYVPHPRGTWGATAPAVTREELEAIDTAAWSPQEDENGEESEG